MEHKSNQMGAGAPRRQPTALLVEFESRAFHYIFITPTIIWMNHLQSIWMCIASVRNYFEQCTEFWLWVNFVTNWKSFFPINLSENGNIPIRFLGWMLLSLFRRNKFFTKRISLMCHLSAIYCRLIENLRTQI